MTSVGLSYISKSFSSGTDIRIRTVTSYDPVSALLHFFFNSNDFLESDFVCLPSGVISRGLAGTEPPLFKFLFVLGGAVSLPSSKVVALILIFKVY